MQTQSPSSSTRVTGQSSGLCPGGWGANLAFLTSPILPESSTSSREPAGCTRPLGACPIPLFTCNQPGLLGPFDLLFSTLRVIPLITGSFHLGFLALPKHRHRRGASKIRQSTQTGVERRHWLQADFHFRLSLEDMAGKRPGVGSEGGDEGPSSALTQSPPLSG